MSIHDGHRERMKERFRREGLDNFTDVQVLELLLFYCIPRRDTNLIAHALLEHFGSLSNVMEATTNDLQQVPGIGENAATFLTLVTAAGRYYMVDRNMNLKILPNLDACGDYMLPYFIGCRNERVMLLCLDSKQKVICCRMLGEGGINSAGVPIRKLVEVALGVGASTVVLAHNHPSGVAIPSDEDLLTTQRVAAALGAVDVILADHIIVADNDYVSMVQSGLYRVDTERILL